MAEMICCSLATTDRATGTLTETHDWAGGACVAFIKSTSHQRGVFNSLRDILRTFSCQPTQHRVRREGDPVDPIALCECGSASMNVAFEWQGASRQPALRLYLWEKKKKRPDATSNCYNYAILLRHPCFSLSLSMSQEEGFSSELLFTPILLMRGPWRFTVSISGE